MAKIVEYVIYFDSDVRKRHLHESGQGIIKTFSVQLETKVKDEWKVIIRYDCSHGFSHLDEYDMNGNKNKKILDLNFENALTYADWDINENWQKYKNKFLGIQ
jgi:hypothetical protein